MNKEKAFKMTRWFQKATRQFVGNALGNQVLPAQSNKAIQTTSNTLRKEFEQSNVSVNFSTERYFVTQGIHASLDTYAIKPKNKSNLYLIKSLGNCFPYEQFLEEAAETASELNANVITYNYRGVGNSTGYAEQFEDLVLDCKTQVKYLMRQGVRPENIVLAGYSLGSAVAVIATKDLHRENIKVKVFCDRGFSSVTNEVVGLIREGRFSGNDYHETKWRKALGHLAKPILKTTLQAAAWEANAAKAYEEIPEEFKAHLVIRSRKEKRNEVRRDDTFVPYYASLHKGLTDKNNASKFETFEDQTEGHLASLKEIHNRYGQSGFEFFKSFVDDDKGQEAKEIFRFTM